MEFYCITKDYCKEFCRTTKKTDTKKGSEEPELRKEHIDVSIKKRELIQ